MAESKRQQKFNRLIQKELGDIFQKHGNAWYGNAFVSVTEVKITPDLGLAKCYISLLMVEDKASFIKLLNDLKPKIRKELGNRIRNQVRTIPDLQFFLDDTYEQGSKIDQIFDDLDIPDETKGVDGNYKKDLD